MTPRNARSRVEQYSEEIADTARPNAWSTEAENYTLDVIGTLTQVPSALGAEIRRVPCLGRGRHRRCTPAPRTP